MLNRVLAGQKSYVGDWASDYQDSAMDAFTAPAPAETPVICVDCSEPITGGDLDWPHHCEDCGEPIHDVCTVSEAADRRNVHICVACWEQWLNDNNELTEEEADRKARESQTPTQPQECALADCHEAAECLCVCCNRMQLPGWHSSAQLPSRSGGATLPDEPGGVHQQSGG